MLYESFIILAALVTIAVIIIVGVRNPDWRDEMNALLIAGVAAVVIIIIILYFMKSAELATPEPIKWQPNEWQPNELWFIVGFLALVLGSCFICCCCCWVYVIAAEQGNRRTGRLTWMNQVHM